MKSIVAQKTRLQIFDPNSETFLTTDASDVRLGAVLSQRQTPEDPERPIAFFNKRVDAAKRNCDVTEKEAIATLKAVEHWEGLLLRRPFTVRTVLQSALRQILRREGKSKRQTSKFIRWGERLGAFDFKVDYIPGPSNEGRLHPWLTP